MTSSTAEAHAWGGTELVIGAALYGAVLSVIGLLAAGWGHGSYLPATVFGAPIALVPGPVLLLAPLVWWPLVAHAIGGSPRPRLGLTLMGVHAATVAAVLLFGTPFESAGEQWQYLDNAQRHTGPLILIGMIIYVIGQAAAWSLVLVRWVSAEPR
jgi:hypothetical protein